MPKRRDESDVIKKTPTGDSAPHEETTPGTAPEDQDTPTNGETPGEEVAADVSAVSDPAAALKTEADKNLDGWQRTLAEFQNYKRRVTREQSELRKKVSLETLGEMLPILDDFERALANIPKELRDNAWVGGVMMIQAKFKKLLDDYNVTLIDPVGEEFDPNRHQAIGTGESDTYKSGQVIETLQKGYQSGDTLIRPALVYVAS